MTSAIGRAFCADTFQKEGYALIDMLAAELKQCLDEKTPSTINRTPPEEMLDYWRKDFESGQAVDFPELAKNILSRSVRFHSRGYMGHQVAVPAPVTALTAALTSYMSNCTTVYELGMVGNAMEKLIIERLAEKFGYDKNATGIITSGGSLGNLTALVTARTSLGVPQENYGKLAIMASEEAHYSVARAARVMGLPESGIITIPSDGRFKIRADLLEEYWRKAADDGKTVFCVVGCSCSTAVGAYDDLNAIADFAEKHNIWFHVDGAHGGAAIYSEKHKSLLAGAERSDSLLVDFHKMMMTPALSTAVLYNASRRKVSEFTPKAAYLWQDQLSKEWYNSAKHTLECTKPMTIVGTYALMRLYGDEIYGEHVDTVYGLGRKLADMVKSRAGMELAVEPECNVVCFRVTRAGRDANELNRRVYDALLSDGAFYIVNTTVRGEFYLRVSVMNPKTREEDLKELLDRVEDAAKTV